MKLAQINFKRALSVILAVMLVVSSLVFAQVSSATTISEDENVFTNLSQQASVTLNFENNNTATQTITADNPRYSSGLVSSTNGSATTTRIYSRSTDGVDDADGSGAAGGIRFAGSKQSCGIMFAYDDIKIGASSVTDLADLYAYKLTPNTTYAVSFKLNPSTTNAAITLNLMGVANRTTTTGDIYYTLSAADTTKGWKTYSTTFTTGADLGDNIYLSFMVLGPTASLTYTANLDTVTITKSVTEDTANVITFNDNGKVYYAYPDSLTALPEGDNGALNCEFLGWVDADGNAVAEVPVAGAVLYAKYPITTEIPDKVDSVYLSLFNTEDATLASNDAKHTLGMVSASNSDHEVYSRDIKIADGTLQWVVKFAHSKAATANIAQRSIAFGKANVIGNRAENAYVLKPNTKYTVSYNIYHENGANISFDLVAASVVNTATGLVLDSNKPDSIIKSWTYYTREFTTPDAETLGENKYLLFVINNPESEKNVTWLYGVTITATSTGTAADCITFTDGEDTFYAAPNALETLPEGANAPEGEEFLGWYDANGKKVTEVPVAGTVLTAKYGVEPKFIAASTRGESGSGATYKSAGVRFRSRIDVAEAGSATEIGFIAAPTAFLNGMTLPEYATSEGNDAISALVKADGMEEIVYAEITDENGKEFKDYQLVITGLTREGYEQNLLSTEISVAMYYIVDGVVNYTDTIAYSYDDVIAMRGN